MKRKIFLLLFLVALFSMFAIAGNQDMSWTVSIQKTGFYIQGEQDTEIQRITDTESYEDNIIGEVGASGSSIFLKDARFMVGHTTGGDTVMFVKFFLEGIEVFNGEIDVPRYKNYRSIAVNQDVDTIRLEKKSGEDIKLFVIEYNYLDDISITGSATVIEGPAHDIGANLAGLSDLNLGEDKEGSCMGWLSVCILGNYVKTQTLSCDSSNKVIKKVDNYNVRLPSGTQPTLGLATIKGECVDVYDDDIQNNAICTDFPKKEGKEIKNFCNPDELSGQPNNLINSLTCSDGYAMIKLKSYRNFYNIPQVYGAECANLNNYNDIEIIGGSNPSFYRPQVVSCPNGYFISEIISTYLYYDTKARGTLNIDAMCKRFVTAGGGMKLGYTGLVKAWFDSTGTDTSTNPNDNVFACVDVNQNGVCDGLEEEVDVCGNNIVESGEECDSTNLGGEDCISQGFESGTLICDANCNFDISQCDDGIIEPPCPLDTTLCADGTCKDVCPPIICDDGTDGFCVIGCNPIDPNCDGGTCARGDGCGGGSCDPPDPDCDGATCAVGDVCLYGCDPIDPDCCSLNSDCCPDFSDSDCDLCLGGNECVVGCDPIDPDCGGGTCSGGDGCAGGNCDTPDPDCDGATCAGGDACLAYCPTDDPDCSYTCNGDGNGDGVCDLNEGCQCDDCHFFQDSCTDGLVCDPIDNICTDQPPCAFGGIAWDYQCINEGENAWATLVANSGCENKQVNFEVDGANTNPLSQTVILSGNDYITRARWTAERPLSFVTFFGGDPQFDIEAILDEYINLNAESNLPLTVLSAGEECDGCGLNVVIGSGVSCSNNVCWEGDEIFINANYGGTSCIRSDSFFLQVDLEDDEGDCYFQLNTTCSSSGNCESVELDYDTIEEPGLCEGLDMFGLEARLYVNEDDDYSNYLQSSDVGGSFEFGSDKYDCEGDTVGGTCFTDDEADDEYDCEVTIPTSGCESNEKCYTDCGDDSCGDVGQWCSVGCNIPLGFNEDFSDYSVGRGECCHSGNCPPLNCVAAYDVGLWSECNKDGYRERSVVFLNVPDYYRNCGDWQPDKISECIVEAPFPFFTWFNLLLSVLILTGYYFWRRK